jgi:ribosome-associated protein
LQHFRVTQVKSMPKSPPQISLTPKASKSKVREPKAADPERAAVRAKSRAAEGTAHKMARLAADAALAKKADEVVLIDLTEKSSYADYLVVCSGTSDRQLSAIAESVEKALKDAGQKPVGSEGHGAGRWVLLDFGDVVIHVFHSEERPAYDLEGLWADAPQTRIEPKPPEANHPKPE